MRKLAISSVAVSLLITACSGDKEPIELESGTADVSSQAKQVILVTGATGRQGGAVARALLDHGYAVRALTRRPGSKAARALTELGAEVYRGDFENPPSLVNALNGATGAFLVTTFAEAGAEGELRHGRNFVDAAAQTGIGHLVFTSAANADREVGISAFDVKDEIERHLEASGVPYTIVRPVSFMDTYASAYDRLASGRFADPIDPDAMSHWIAVSDIGRIVAEIFDDPATWIGQSIDISGDALSMRGLANTFGRVMGIDMVYSRTPWAVYQARFGPGAARLKRWFESPGYDVDVAAVRARFPGLLTFEEYLRQTGWADRAEAPKLQEDGRLKAFSHVTVGVADLDVAYDLWVEQIGMEVIAEGDGPDAGLASLWGLDPSAISRQALLRTPGNNVGGIHFVEFSNPGAPVREGANVFDMVPKNLDIFAHDLPARYEELKAAGAKFRGTPSEVTSPSGVTFREVHMLAHDFVNVVLVEVIGDEHHYSPKGFLALGPVITIAPDAEAEKQFWMDAAGLDLLSENLLSGPEVERMVGLPPGSGLNIKIVGDKAGHSGGIEIVEYQGVEGRNLYPLAHPPALGNLHVNYVVPDLGPLRVRLAAAGAEITEYGEVSTIFGSGNAIAFHTPAGLRVEVHERR